MEDEETLLLLLDYERAAKALSLSRAALRDLVYKGRGPVVTKIGRRTFFAVEDLKAFVAQHRQCAAKADATGYTAPKRKRGRPSISELMEREDALA